MANLDNRLVERLLQFKNANEIRIERKGNTLTIDGVDYVFPRTSQIRQNSVPYSR